MLNIFVNNLGKYNEGEFVGDWLKLPKEVDEIEKFLTHFYGKDNIKNVIKYDKQWQKEYPNPGATT